MSLPGLRLDRASAAADERARVDLERVIFFSDAVFAIAITLLAIDLRLPALATPVTNESLLRAIADLIPEINAFGLSFMVVSLFWLGHYRTFRMTERVTNRLILLNLLLLAGIALVPFPTSVLAHHGNLAAAAVFYGSFVLLLSLLSSGLFVYAYRAGLTAPAVTPVIARHVTARALAVPIVFLVSLPIALVNPALAEDLWFASLILQTLLSRRFQIEAR